MAYVWMKDESGWAVASLAGRAYALEPEADPPIRKLELDGFLAGELGVPAPATLLIMGDRDQWSLLCGSSSRARVNGYVVATGIRALRDRDEIFIRRSSRYYFSTEQLAAISPHGGEEEAICPRCKQQIAPHTPSVLCPNCGVVHHQAPEEERECWTYAEQCAVCDQQTDLDGGFRWTPEHL